MTPSTISSPTPSHEPSPVQSSVPSSDPCGLNKKTNFFKISLTPDSFIHHKPEYMQLIVQRRSRAGVDTDFDDNSFALRRLRLYNKADQVFTRCLWIKGCYRVVIYSHYAAKIGIGDGLFEAYWNGKQEVEMHFPFQFVFSLPSF